MIQVRYFHRMNWKRMGMALLLPALLAVAGCAHVKPTTPTALRAEMQKPLDGATSASLARELTLRQAVELTARRNPGVAARRQEWLAAIHRYPQAVTPDDPQVRDLSYDFEMNSWTSGIIEQDIPWPQKLWYRGKVADTEADIARLRYEAALRDAIIEAKNAYYELYYLDHAAEITARIEGQFRNDAVLAYGELNKGRTELGEAFRAESQAAQLVYDRQLLVEQRAAVAERLRAQLNLPPGTVIGPVREAKVYPVTEQVEPLYERAERYAEALKARGLESQKASYETFLARLERIPNVMPGALISNISSANQSYMGMLTFKLPIWEWRNRAMINERKAMEEAARRMAMEELNQQRRAVATAYFAVRVNQRLVALYADTLLPQAESVMRQAEILFRNDQASFSNLLETTLAWHNFQLAYHRAQADLGQSIGKLEQAIGTTAEPRPAQGAKSETSGAAKNSTTTGKAK